MYKSMIQNKTNNIWHLIRIRQRANII